MSRRFKRGDEVEFLWSDLPVRAKVDSVNQTGSVNVSLPFWKGSYYEDLTLPASKLTLISAHARRGTRGVRGHGRRQRIRGTRWE